MQLLFLHHLDSNEGNGLPIHCPSEHMQHGICDSGPILRWEEESKPVYSNTKAWAEFELDGCMYKIDIVSIDHHIQPVKVVCDLIYPQHRAGSSVRVFRDGADIANVSQAVDKCME